MISPNQQMSITKTSEGKKWNASVMGYSFKFYVTEDNQSESADWSGNYTVVLDKGENLSFSGCWTGTVAVEGTGGGTTTGKIEMECTTKTPLLFYPYCSRESHRAGEVEYGFSNPLDASRAGYPSATVDMKFVKGDGCSFSVYIKYNGKEAQWQ